MKGWIKCRNLNRYQICRLQSAKTIFQSSGKKKISSIRASKVGTKHVRLYSTKAPLLRMEGRIHCVMARTLKDSVCDKNDEDIKLKKAGWDTHGLIEMKSKSSAIYQISIENCRIAEFSKTRTEPYERQWRNDRRNGYAIDLISISLWRMIILYVVDLNKFFKEDISMKATKSCLIV